MKQSTFFALCLTGALTTSVGAVTAAAQANVPVVQNGASRPAVSRGAPVAKPIANRQAVQPRVVARPNAMTPRTVTPNAPRVATQPSANLRPNYPPQVSTSGPKFAALTVQQNVRNTENEPITVDPKAHQTELRNLAEMRARQRFGSHNRTLATLNQQRHVNTNVNSQRHLSTNDPAVQRQPQTNESRDKGARKHGHKKDHRNYAEAFRCHWREWHNRDWWHDHCQTIVYVSTGYYFLDGSYWYPAWGYDPVQTYNDYDGPIYTYGNLLPDEVIANVQTALQDTGYYSGPITGSLNGETRAAIAAFQRDYGLPITGAVDEPTVEVLGLYQSNDSYDFQTDQGDNFQTDESY
jgi:Putative peptidoglycan binding domain